MIRRVFLAFLVFGLVNLAGCGDGGTGPQVAATVTLSPTTLSFSSFGETQQLTTTVLDGNGATISSASVTGVLWPIRRKRFVHGARYSGSQRNRDDHRDFWLRRRNGIGRRGHHNRDVGIRVDHGRNGLRTVNLDVH